MANSHAEDATSIAAAIRPLATREELGESEQRLNAASETLRREMLEEIRDSNERMRKKLKADLERAVNANRVFHPLFVAFFQGLFATVLMATALVVIVLGLSELLMIFFSSKSG